MAETEYKICPNCSGTIKALAIKCKHCHAKLDADEVVTPPELISDNQNQAVNPPRVKKGEKSSKLFDFLNVKEYKAEIETLQTTIDYLQSKIVEIGAMDFIEKEQRIAQLEMELTELENRKKVILGEIEAENIKLDLLRNELVVTEDELLLQSFGLYKAKYEFMNSEQYKNKLDEIRNLQKELIKKGYAASGNLEWTVNGSKAEGNKMVKDMQKLLLRAFNSECEQCISKVRYSNFEASEKRIAKAHEAISKLGRVMNIAISDQYYRLKNDELHLAFEYQQMKEEEKEEQRLIRVFFARTFSTKLQVVFP